MTRIPFGKSNQGARMMTHPSSLSLVVDIRRRSINGAEQPERAGNTSSHAWILALHAIACRRWLASEPPCFDQAQRTLQLMHEMALELGLTSVVLEEGDVGRCPVARHDALHRRLVAVERAFLDSVVVDTH
jgi:hypothetical protein